MKIHLKPLGARVVIQRHEDDERSAGGIIIPGTAQKEKPVMGRVLAVGPGMVSEDGIRVPLDVETGDEVFFSKYAGTDLEVDGEDYLIIDESDLLAISVSARSPRYER